MRMDLFEDERVLFRTTADDLFVTTHRVRDGSESKFTSIMLEEVCSVRVGRRAYRWRLVLAVICDALAAYFAFIVQDGQGSAPSLSLALLGGLSLAAYYVIRSTVVEIASRGARIQFEMSSVSEVAEFVTTLESAKNERYLLMARAGKGVADQNGAGTSILASGSPLGDTHPPVLDPLERAFGPEHPQCAAGRANSLPPKNSKTRNSLISERFLRHLSAPRLPSPGLGARRGALSRRQGQRGDRPHHASKQAPHQVAV
jgi:hypothetical protein